MIWPAMLFNLCVGLLLAGHLLRGVRRFERRADALMAKMNEQHAERMARLDRRHAEELRKYDIARDEIRASMWEKVNAAIAKIEVATQSAVDQMSAESRNLLDRAPAELPPLAHHEPDGHVPTQPIEH